MTTSTKTVEMVVLKAAAKKVLCNGSTRTSVGGTVTMGSDQDTSEWKEMTPDAADKLIAETLAKEEKERKAQEEAEASAEGGAE